MERDNQSDSDIKRKKRKKYILHYICFFTNYSYYHIYRSNENK